MNPRFQNIALVLALAFLVTFVVLLWLVQRLFRARGWHALGTPSRPIRVRSRLVSRLIGLGFALVGAGFVAWSWYDADTSRRFSFKMATLGPCFLGIGAWMVIEGPLTPEDGATVRPSALAWVLMFLGLGAGLLYAQFLETGRWPFLS